MLSTHPHFLASFSHEIDQLQIGLLQSLVDGLVTNTAAVQSFLPLARGGMGLLSMFLAPIFYEYAKSKFLYFSQVKRLGSCIDDAISPFLLAKLTSECSVRKEALEALEESQYFLLAIPAGRHALSNTQFQHAVALRLCVLFAPANKACKSRHVYPFEVMSQATWWLSTFSAVLVVQEALCGLDTKL